MKINKLLIGFFLVILFIAGCGKSKKEEIQKKDVPAKTIQKKSSIKLVVTGDDFMKFNRSKLKVKQGQKVILTLRHIGKLDKNVMGHNLVILKKDVDVADFASKAIAFKDNEYIPKDSEEILAYTKMIGGGEETTIEFMALEVGEYDFICSFPGHYGMMKGKFIVE